MPTVFDVVTPPDGVVTDDALERMEVVVDVSAAGLPAYRVDENASAIGTVHKIPNAAGRVEFELPPSSAYFNAIYRATYRYGVNIYNEVQFTVPDTTDDVWIGDNVLIDPGGSSGLTIADAYLMFGSSGRSLGEGISPLTTQTVTAASGSAVAVTGLSVTPDDPLTGRPIVGIVKMPFVKNDTAGQGWALQLVQDGVTLLYQWFWSGMNASQNLPVCVESKLIHPAAGDQPTFTVTCSRIFGGSGTISLQPSTYGMSLEIVER